MGFEWNGVCLRDICEKIGSGATPKGGKETYSTSGISLIRSQNVLDFQFSTDGLAHISEVQANKLNNACVEFDDVLLNITGDSVARACKVASNVLPARVNQHVAIIRGKRGVVLNSYLLYYLQMKKSTLLMLSSGGATRKALTKQMIEDISIPVPDISVQRQIVELLDEIQEKIETNNAINKNLEKQAQTIYQHMFGDSFIDGFRVGELSEIADITMGQSPKGDTYNEYGDGTVFYQGRAEFGFRFPTRRLFTTEPKRMARENDVLMSVRAPVGDMNVARENCCIGRGLASIRSKFGHQSFILYTMFDLRKQIDIFNGEGTVFGSINRDALNSLPVQIPSAEQIEQFEKIVAPMDSVIRNNHEELCRLETIRDALLPRLMSGEIDVSGIEI